MVTMMDIQLCAERILLVTTCLFYTLSSAQVNLALNKLAWQSSTHQNNQASYAVDGIKGHDMSGGTKCSQTNMYNWPWWAVDLEQISTIRSVRIYNQGNTEQCPDCQKQLRGFRLYTFTPGDSGTRLIYSHSSDNVDLPLIIDVLIEPPETERYLYIFIPREANLTLCEVEVYDTSPPTSSTSSTTESTVPTELTTSTVLSTDSTTESTVQAAMPTSSTVPTSSTTKSTEIAEMPTSSVPSTSSSTEVTVQAAMSTSSAVSTSSTTESTEIAEMSTSSLLSTSSTKESTASTKIPTASVVLDQITTPVAISTVGLSGNTSDCFCETIVCPDRLSSVEKKKFTAHIVDSLTIDTKNVSRERRRYESVQDDRPSSQMMGGLGIAMMVLVFGSIVMSDTVSLLYYIWRQCSTPTKKGC